ADNDETTDLTVLSRAIFEQFVEDVWRQEQQLQQLQQGGQPQTQDYLPPVLLALPINCLLAAAMKAEGLEWVQTI
ncbi:unnamed protein product, partial [Amoebophrya sp. A25]